MKRIIVTTDFSANSKKAIRFALQLALQTHCELVFYNVLKIVKTPDVWDTIYYGLNENEAIEHNQSSLKKFIDSITNDYSLPKINYKCVTEPGNDVVKHIIKYAEQSNANFICIGTRGAGTIEKLFGTIVSELIIKSTIPIIAVPKNYRMKPLQTICYASDMENIDEEIKAVTAFSVPLNAKVSVLHYEYETHLKMNKEKLSHLALKHENEHIMFHFKKLNALYPLIKHLKRDIIKFKPSLLIVFTKQNRKWFDRLLGASNSANMAFDTKVPIMICRKNNE